MLPYLILLHKLTSLKYHKAWASNIFMTTGCKVVVGWIMGRTSKTNSMWCAYLLKLLCNVFSVIQFTKVASGRICNLESRGSDTHAIRETQSARSDTKAYLEGLNGWRKSSSYIIL